MTADASDALAVFGLLVAVRLEAGEGAKRNGGHHARAGHRATGTGVDEMR